MYDYYIGRFKATPPHRVWTKHFTKKVFFCNFWGCTRPFSSPYGGNGVCRSRQAAALKYSGSAYDIVKQDVFATYCKEYQLFTHTMNYIIIATCNTHRIES